MARKTNRANWRQTVGMTMTTKELKHFEDLAKARGLTRSALMRELVAEEVARVKAREAREATGAGIFFDQGDK